MNLEDQEEDCRHRLEDGQCGPLQEAGLDSECSTSPSKCSAFKMLEYEAASPPESGDPVEVLSCVSNLPEAGPQRGTGIVAPARFYPENFREMDAKTYSKHTFVKAVKVNFPFYVRTIEGTMSGKSGDYLARGNRGEIYPVDREIFEEKYKEVEP